MTRTAILCTLSAIVIAGFASPASAGCHLAPLKTYPCPNAPTTELGTMKAGDTSATAPSRGITTTQHPNVQRKDVPPRRQDK